MGSTIYDLIKKKKRRVQVTPGITWQELHYL